MTAAVAGGTGDMPDHSPPSAPPHHAVAEAVSGTVVVEQEGDLHEYGHSLGVDLDEEAEEDLAWVVREAFNASLPSNWTEYMDASGRAYYIKDGSTESTWEHPMDQVYRELLGLIKSVRQRQPPATESQREEFVKQHLTEVHQRARSDLAGWNGPYMSEQGEYYYNDVLKLSSWDSPVLGWEKELALRHMVLSRYLLPEQAASGGSPASLTGGASGGGGHNMLQAWRLQLGNLQRAPGDGDAPEPSTSRSYHTARSHCSSRSGRSKHKERKERKEDGHHRFSEERRAEREARRAAAAASNPTVAEGSATYQADGDAAPYPNAD